MSSARLLLASSILKLGIHKCMTGSQAKSCRFQDKGALLAQVMTQRGLHAASLDLVSFECERFVHAKFERDECL